ncbi:phage head-tail adapter protein [Staphylococcus simulans]|nr:phage head-tail adapter protein [Staphylococcus simulans]PTJ09100.1 phage head-tail adapter protein [Staphylococcus simulans]PTJ14056.1 phage head-tail adapter protein [Staphylococcus simulans]PTJ38157.1 phage head-tail adapter protein [Staphylococcus simulans]PTJ42124.1 phage head-tail adapter protein [Staphylococcus simulans]
MRCKTMDVLKVKLINEWDLQDTSKDEEIVLLIPHYLKVAEEYCHRSFASSLPHGVEEFIAHSIATRLNKHSNLAGRSMGTVSYTYKDSDDQHLYDKLKQYRKVNWGGNYVY